MHRFWLVGALLFLSCVVSGSDEISVKPGAPEVYTVQKGDTLWDISGLYLAAPWLWPRLWEVNPEIDNPHLIYPGDQIRLTFVNGQPRLSVHRGSAPTVKGVKKLSPEVRRSSLAGAIPLIHTEDIASWVRQARIVDPRDLDQSPYIVAGEEDRMLLATGARVFVAGLPEERHRVQGIYRPGQTYRDPDSGQVIGVEAVEVGVAHVEKSAGANGEYSLATIVSLRQEIRAGDHLLPSEAMALAPTISPRAPEDSVSGEIIALGDDQTRAGRFAAAVINRGTTHGLMQGHLLTVSGPGRTVRDPKTGEKATLPGREKGHLMVYRSYPMMAYVLVLNASDPLLIGDQFESP